MWLVVLKTVLPQNRFQFIVGFEFGGKWSRVLGRPSSNVQF